MSPMAFVDTQELVHDDVFFFPCFFVLNSICSIGSRHDEKLFHLGSTICGSEAHRKLIQTLSDVMTRTAALMLQPGSLFCKEVVTNYSTKKLSKNKRDWFYFPLQTNDGKAERQLKLTTWCC